MPRYLSLPFYFIFFVFVLSRPHIPATNAVRLSSDFRSCTFSGRRRRLCCSVSFHKISKLVHSAKCKFYTERIALASSSKELHQIVNILSNRHPPKILSTI